MHQLLLLAGLCSAAPGLTGAVALQVREIEAPLVRGAELPLHEGVLVHGLDRDTADTTSHGAGKTTVWDTLRTTALRERVAQSYKTYLYRYPTYRTTRENGARLAQLIRQVEPDLPDRQLALCAHSMGG